MAQKAPDYDLFFKVVLLGEPGTGKSSFFHRKKDGQWVEKIPLSTDDTVHIEKSERDGTRLKVQLIDTGGQEKFRKITSSHYRGCTGILLFYDPTDEASFNALDDWKKECDSYAMEKPAIFLISAKKDLEDQWVVTEEQIEEWNKEHGGIPVHEISAKDDVGCTEVWYVCLCLTRRDEIVNAMMANAKGKTKGGKAEAERRPPPKQRRRCDIL